MKKFLFILAILWMGFIFYNSATKGNISNLRSNEVVNTIRTGKNLIEGNKAGDKSSKLSNDAKTEKINLFIRKNAHAFEYMVLAIILSTLLRIIGVKWKDSLVYIMFICLFYAVTDEYHQSFVPGRTSLVSDVLIDFLGSIIGILFYSVASFIVERLSEN